MTTQKFSHFVAAILLLATFTAADVDNYQCRELFEHDATKVGNVSSPFYGQRQYHSGLWCEYRIRAPKGYRIKLTFKDFDIDPNGGCGSDRLTVYGKDQQSTLGVFCGYELPKPLLSNEGENEIRLLFETDHMVSGRGFLIQYESSPYFKSVCADGEIQCINRNCFKSAQKCDGFDDCGDGTDEVNCGRPIVTEPENCGEQAIKPNTIYDADRMVGGEIVVPNSWPWQVSLQHTFTEPNAHFCGGSLINEQWVLTATHCVVNFPDPGDIKIHLGAHGKYNTTQYEQVRRSGKVIAYPDLEGDKIRTYSMTHDISLIKLNAPVKFNKGVQPACLPQLGWKVDPDWTCYATGWGVTRGSGGSDVLKQMEQVTLPPTKCSFDENTQICVAKRNNSPCHGDSGGPLQCKLGDKYYVFGAASFVTTTNFMGGLCTGPGAKTVYANAADKAEWIKTIINKYS